MDIENTDLERRVWHEQILKVLIAHMAKRSQKFLDRRQQISFDDSALGRLFDRFTLHKRIVPPEDPLSIMAVDALFPTPTKRDIFLHIVHRLLGLFRL